MRGLEISQNIISCFGNRAGYIKGKTAVMDSAFESSWVYGILHEKELEVEWKQGVLEALAGDMVIDGSGEQIQSVRIWQLRTDSDIQMRFIPYDRLLQKYGEPERRNYEQVFDGQLGTNDLEEIYMKLNTEHPEGYRGHSLSMSDIVELHDGESSSFFYVDRIGFQEIAFDEEEPQLTIGMQF